MSNKQIKYEIYVLLGKLKREGKESIEVRELMRELGYRRSDPDAIFFIVMKTIELEFKVKIYGRK